MRERKYSLRGVGLGVLPLLSALGMAPAQATDMSFSGTLVYAPCKIRAGDENLSVDFGAVVDKYLYTNTRTLGKTFSLNLVDCDTAASSWVKLTFNGMENLNLPGLLAVTGVSGIGVGIETAGASAVQLPLNEQGPQNLLSTTSTTTTLSFKAYVQGEPFALANKTITRGAFSATATFVLEYE
ncbi:fimbrial protein [Serratia sp. IR-2025]